MFVIPTCRAPKFARATSMACTVRLRCSRHNCRRQSCSRPRRDPVWPPWCSQCDECTRMLSFHPDAVNPCQWCNPCRTVAPGSPRQPVDAAYTGSRPAGAATPGALLGHGTRSIGLAPAARRPRGQRDARGFLGPLPRRPSGHARAHFSRAR